MVRMEIEPEALEARVPNLVLQPLVENAIRYAVAPREVESAIEIRATRRNGLVELQVRDDGPGIDELGGEAANGIGLANTRSRLDKLYGAAHSFRLSPAVGGGTQVTITIPFRPVEGSEVSSGG